MIKEVAIEVEKSGLRRIGILGTPSTLRLRFYQKELNKINVESVIPEDEQIKDMEKIIRNVVAGKLLKKDKDSLSKIAGSMYKRGAQGIILGCTEIPQIFPKNYKKKVFNSVEILSYALLRDYYKSNTILET